ncbi:MAG: 6-hydroxymethylpterin diphosphokinase MptE-like protein [Thermoplasmata archaeon]
MNLKEWMLIYKNICSDLGIDPDTDLLSSFLLSRFVGKEKLLPLKNENIYVIGNAPWISEIIDEVPESVTSVVADSAIDAYFKYRGPPDYIVSDLDGNVDLIEKCKNEGSKIIIHAHGDNMDKIMKYSYIFDDQTIGTTQNLPLKNVYNFFGFTDGDRAAFIADYLVTENIYLVGFDFEHPSFKQNGDPLRKKKKLGWAKRLLSKLAEERGSIISDSPIIRI